MMNYLLVKELKVRDLIEIHPNYSIFFLNIRDLIFKLFLGRGEKVITCFVFTYSINILK